MNKKTFALPAFALLASLLPACVVDSETPVEGMIDAPAAAAPESAPEVDGQLATIEVAGGKVVFVDEGDGIAFFEVGNVDLSSLLDGANASALEVFLALAPEGTPVPARLVAHHAEVVDRTGTVPAEPRDLAPLFVMPEVQNLTNEALGHNGSGTNCWGWGGTTSNYDAETGYGSFSLSSFQSNFISSYSQITGSAAQVSNAGVILNSTNNGYVTTSWGHERAMAFCASKAVLLDAQSNCNYNRVYAYVDVDRTDENGNYVNAGSIYIDQFGEGARFRSNYTNSGGTARRYSGTVTFYAHDYENLHGADTIGCQDQMAVVWRSKHTGGDIIAP